MNRKIASIRRHYFRKEEVGTGTILLAIATVIIIFLSIYNA